MSTIRKLSGYSLKSKLVTSYLLVILGTVIVLIFAVSLAIQNYYRNAEISGLADQIKPLNNNLVTIYQQSGSLNVETKYGWNQPTLLAIIVDAKGNQQYCSSDDPNNQPSFDGQGQHGNIPFGNNQFIAQNCDDSSISQTLKQTLQGTIQLSGDIQLNTNTGLRSYIYVSTPIIVNEKVVGASYTAVLNAMAAPYGINGTTQVINQINLYICLAGLGVAVVAALCSYLFVRRFVRPLESLTMAAEQMKQGSYTQRVTHIGSQDEIGRLALTFNEMADTIETDVNELHHQDQMRREMIANIAHDLATPLTAIQGLSEALADDVIQGPVARQETAQRIGREVQRLHRLVADVRQMTMMEAGQIKLDLAPLDLNSLVDETVLVIEPECEASGIVIKNGIPANAPYVQADSDRLTQVLLNLLDNARRHTNNGGKIGIWATQPQGKKDTICITVADTGVGIDPKDLPHIFERFYRADRSRAAITGGSGLGLAIVKAIITAHGGQVWAESKLGQGTHIMFTLPLAQKSMNIEHQKPPQLASPSYK
jgi:two-component system, OmpR family, sensor histidine kinase BaeS